MPKEPTDQTRPSPPTGPTLVAIANKAIVSTIAVTRAYRGIRTSAHMLARIQKAARELQVIPPAPLPSSEDR